MKHGRLESMIKGWFVGAFEPSVLRTDACEVAIKTYRAGEYESRHQHRVATEITAIVSGRVRMMGKDWSDGDIVVVEPGESTDFAVYTDTITVVVKLPSVAGDKYPAEE